MRIVHISSTGKKASKKQLEREKAKRWMLKQKSLDRKNALKMFASEIQDIQQLNPEFLSGKIFQL